MHKKKLLFSLLFMGLGIASYAQNKNVNKAEDLLKSGDLDKARLAINEATVNEKTADKAKTWYIQGQVYEAIANNDKFKDLVQDPLDSAFAAFKKCLEIDSKFTSMLLTNYKDLTNIYAKFYQKGADAFNNKDYKTAYEKFKDVKNVNDYLYGMKLGMGAPMDTMAILNMSNAAYNNGDEANAIPGYEQLAAIKYKEPFIYKVLLRYYRDKNDEQNYLKTIAAAKELFPNDTDFANEEISYYSSTGKMDQLVQKLEEAVQKKPEDFDLNFNLGVTYDNMANPKDDSGYSAAKPDNYAEMFDKAVNYYKKAISIQPDNYAANFNLGLMFYNGAAAIGREIGKLGTSKEEQARQDSLLKRQDSLLDSALPYLDKTYQLLDAKDKLDQNELAIYKNTLMGLQGIYARKNQMDKYNDIKKKLEAADSKAG